MKTSPFVAPSKLLALCFAGALLLPAIPLSAQMPETPIGKWWKRPRVVEALKLQPDQQSRLEEVFLKNRRAFIDLKADLDRRAIDLEDLMAKKDSDPAKIAAASDAVEQARTRLAKARTMMIVEMKAILTAQQWQMILDRRDQWRFERDTERHRQMRERLGGGGPAARPPQGPSPRDEEQSPR